MVGTVNHMKIESINGILKKKFPGYTVIGNKPYAKGVLLIKMGASPKIVQYYTSNFEAFNAINAKEFHPEAKKEFGELFDPSETECKGLQLKNLGRAALDHFDQAKQLFSIFNINLPMKLRTELYYRIRQIKIIKK